MKDEAIQVKLINQALAAAAASIELSKQLLAELAGAPAPQPNVTKAAASKPNVVPVSAASIPGTVGVFDGENMVAEDGKKYPVPANYASKTLLVFGDKLKMIDGESGKIFKQIERVKRQRVAGTLSQKGNGWSLETPEGSYKVLEAAVKHFEAKPGDRLVGILPKDVKSVPFAALEGPETPKVEPVGPVAIPVEIAKPVKKVGEKSPQIPEVVAEAPLPKAKIAEDTSKRVTKTAVKIAEPKVEKTEKKNEPVISEDDLR